MSTSNRFDDPGVMEVTGKVLIATIVALCVVLVLVFLFHVYARWLWHRRRQDMDGHNGRRRQDHHSGVTVLRRGLDVSFLKTIPVIQFDSKSGSLECSVCLSEVEDGEKTRILPKCNHGFHAECIDMWFHSHSTCPICRNPVSEQTQISVESLLEDHQTQTQDQEQSAINANPQTLPTNVLFWGDETEVSTVTCQLEEAINSNHQAPGLHFEPTSSSASSSSSSSSSQTNNDRRNQDLVIDVPRERYDNGDEDEKTPVASGMRSLMRILSSGRRFNPFSPRNNNSNGQEQSPSA